MATPEGRVKDAVRKVLKEVGAYWHMPSQNGRGARSLDFIGCYRGAYFGIETKAPGKVPTGNQEITMRAIREADGACFVIDGIDPGQFSEFRMWTAAVDAAIDNLSSRL